MVFHLFSRKTLSHLKTELLKRGFTVHVLDGHSIDDEGSFLRIFARDVPFEVFTPNDLVPPINWDAFVDCFGSGLSSRPKTKLAIIWEGADRMLDGRLPLLVNAVECISGEADKVTRYDPSILLRVFLVGDGPNFPDYPGVRRVFAPEASEVPCVEIRTARDNGNEVI
jgi:hypothetical protein